MERRGRRKMWLALFVLVLFATFQGCSVAADQLLNNRKIILAAASSAANRVGSSVVLPVRGNVYPQGLYYATLFIGNPPKPYFFDIDTGSDLTWLQCDAPCVSCSKVPHPLYQPHNNIVFCEEPICSSFHSSETYGCNQPKDQCDYNIEYADHASSLGVLVRDIFPFRFSNGSLLIPRLAFGCGYDQQGLSAVSPTDGVLGLGNGKSSIISQLRDRGLTRNVIGHCFSHGGGGFLFFGDDVVPSSGVIWTPMARSSLNKHYSPGLAELIFGGRSTGVKDLHAVFDSGSSYTYFNSKAYQVLVTAVKKDLTGKPLREALDDKTLPLCWKGAKPFKSLHDVKKYFKPIILSFANRKKAELEITPESYLIITKNGNVCLGILNGTEMGLENLNIIGDTSVRDKMVIYDNEKQRIGWVPADCNKLPIVGRDDEAFYQPYTARLGILSEQFPGTYAFREDL